MLTDWTDLDPAVLFARLKKMSDYDNYSKRTVGDFFDDVQKHGLEATLANRKLWGEMRMMPTDLSDVNGNTYTYLMNGTTSIRAEERLVGKECDMSSRTGGSP